MKGVMQILAEELSPSDYGFLTVVTEGFAGPPFEYSAKRKEFTPSDEWFAFTWDDDSPGDGEGEPDPDAVMELAWRCVGILAGHASELDLQGMAEKEPVPTRHILEFTIGTEELADKVMKALNEAGYSGMSVRKSGDGWVIGLPFTASTDWEFETEGTALKSTIEMIIRCCEGKSTMAARV